MVNGRAKGHAMERDLAKRFRELGFDKCKCSRAESKSRDDAKVDLVETGIWNVQSKALEKFGQHHDVLKSMPVEEGQINVIIHRKNRKGGTATISEEDFWKLVERLK